MSLVFSLRVFAAVVVLVSGSSVFAQFGGTAQNIGGFGGGGGFGQGGIMPTTTRLQLQEPQSAVANAARQVLDETVELAVGELPLEELPEKLFQQMGVPVLLDSRGLKVAEVKSDATIQILRGGMPLRTTLRESLAPLNLQAIVEEDGLLITVDPTALSRSGKPNSQWVNISDADALQVEQKLNAVSSLSFFDVPLDQALRQISEDCGVTLVLDVRGMEEIGLAVDEPVTVDLKDVRLRTGLQLMLEEMDLTYINRGEFLAITNIEVAESQLLTRIYWIDGIGTPDVGLLMETIQSSLRINSWEAMGGEATIVPLKMQHRSGIVVTATTQLHSEIDSFLNILRANHFGADGKYETIEVPVSGGFSGSGGGMGGGGFF